MAQAIIPDDAVLDDGVPHPVGVDLPDVPVPPPLAPRSRYDTSSLSWSAFRLYVVTEARRPGLMRTLRQRHLSAHAAGGPPWHVARAAFCAAVESAVPREG